MLHKIAVSVLFLSVCVAAVPLLGMSPRDVESSFGEPPAWDQHGSVVYEQRRAEVPSLLRDSDETGSGDGSGATPQEKKPAEGKGREPVGVGPKKSDTVANGKPEKVPEKGTDKTLPTENGTKPTANGKNPTDGAESPNNADATNGTGSTNDTKPPDNTKPTDGTGSTDKPPRGEPGEKTPPSTDEDIKPATGPDENTKENPPSSENSPSGEKEPTVPETQPKDTTTSGTGKEKPDFAPDGEEKDQLDNDLTPAGVIGGVIAGAALIVAAFVAWSRRSVGQPQSYEPVQPDDIDADGWNNGWEEGWEEGTSTKA